MPVGNAGAVTPRASSESSLLTMRLLAAAAVVLVLGFAWVRGGGEDVPFVERVAISIGFLAFLAATYFSARVRARAHVPFQALMVAIALWSLFNTARGGFSADGCVGLIIAVSTVGLVFPTARALGAYYLVMIVATGTSTAFAESTAVRPGMLVATLTTMMVVSWVVSRGRDRARVELEELSLATSRVHNGVLFLDRQGRIRWANDGHARLMGSPPGTLVGSHFLDLVAAPPTQGDAVEMLTVALRDGLDAHAEIAHARSDGGLVWVAVDLTAVRDDDGRPDRFIVVESDITGARATFARILDAMSDALLVVLPDGRVRSVNPAACRLLGAPPLELQGRDLAGFLVPGWRWGDALDAEPTATAGSGSELLTELLREDPDAGEPVLRDLDLAFRARDGEVIPVLAAASALRAEAGEPRRVVIVARDARDRLRLDRERTNLERKVRQAQKLESLGVLAGGIAHDFNNLLVGILGNASLAQGRLAEGTTERHLVDGIERSATRAADLTRQMLAYAGLGQFVIERIDLSTLVREMSELLSASHTKRARFVLDLAAGLPPVEGDPAQLGQVVMNLLTNASDALAGHEGTITLRTRVEQAPLLDPSASGDDLRQADAVCLEVIDTGVGMPDEVRRRMFDPFFTTKTAGRGLGLAATLGIVHGHRGTIQVRSQPGRGTAVRVFLPASTGTVPTRTPTPAPSGWQGRGVALIADDDLVVREFIAAVLEPTGMEIVAAENGREAVDRFRERSAEVAVVLLDLTMPEMTGDEALREIRGIRADVPVILSSGWSEADARKRSVGGGGVSFLQKPYKAAALLARVEELVRPRGG